MPPLRRVSIQGYRAARELELTPGSVCALVGEASSGKSTVLTAIWTLLEAAAPPPTIDDVARDGEGRTWVSRGAASASRPTSRRGTIFLDARPPDTLNLNRAGAPPVLFLPANLRSRTLVAPATGRGAAEVAELLQPPAVDRHWAAADGGLALVAGMERLLASNLRHFVLLIEEPELYLSPHAQRHLYGLLRALAQAGNQILYSTHAPVFLSVDKLEELALVRHTPTGGTSLFQPEPLAEAETFRALSEFDSDRAELFLARCAVLVEGRTEKLTFPLVFEALGVDADKEGILVLECGGKGNMPLFARIANACSIPYVVVHDRDAPRGVVAGRVRAGRQPPDPRGCRQQAHGRAHARLRERVRPQGEQPRPQAAEGMAALPRQRRGARAAPGRGREGAEDRAGALAEAAAARACPCCGHLVGTAFELVGKRLELRRLAGAQPVGERLREQPVGEPRVTRQKRPVEIRADHAADTAALEAALAVVAEAGEHASEWLRAGIEARSAGVVLESGERPLLSRLELALDEHVADHALLAGDGLERKEADARHVLAVKAAVAAAEQLVAAAHGEQRRAPATASCERAPP